MKINLTTMSVLVTILCLYAAGCSGVRPPNLGVKEGKLAPCPASLNCVSSQSSDAGHVLAPLSFSGTVPEAHAGLKRVLLGMKRVKIITETDTYMHAEFTSAIFRFVDDVEFWFDANGKVVHVRSASRMGHSDLGVNRKRVEDIRAQWNSMVQ